MTKRAATKRRPIVRRWRLIENWVLCEYHGEVHRREQDHYQMDEADMCCEENWRNLAVLGTPADVDGY